jgi:hypothetical protein
MSKAQRPEFLISSRKNNLKIQSNNVQSALVHVLPKLYQATAVRREDMTARTIIAKLVAFLFVQDSVRSSIKFI